MNLIEQLVTHLDKISSVRHLTDRTEAIQIALFPDQPFEGAISYVTLGLSHHPLRMPDGRDIRQEIIFCSWNDANPEHISSSILTFCEFMLSKHQPLLRGDVVGPSVPIFAGTMMNSVYAAIPVIFPDDLHLLGETEPPTVLVWLIPLYETESAFVKQQGWRAFEQLMESKNPDLLDFNRPHLC
ncbi:suppressor of fused domain protein [Pseudomonas sp. nanlin1]|uniref:suppressor of fused domain protein n=1 Tax=Pseudomonas sp. nanlin1 TaxID=3040605 RepID=UPI00388DE305